MTLVLASPRGALGALTAVAVTLLTVYDMLKAVDRSMRIERVQLESKAGGQHGDWTRPAEA